MFKFPIRLYDPTQDIVNSPLNPLKWVRGWKRIFPEDITDIGDIFFNDDDIDDVITRGTFTASTIGTTEITYTYDWSRTILEKKLLEHIKRIEEYDNPPKKKKKPSPIPIVSTKTSHNIALK